MKKKLIILLLCLLTGCVPQESDEGYITPNVYRIDCDGDFDYIVDKDTGVVYLMYLGYCKYGITPCYNADGTLKTVDDIKEKSDADSN